MGYSGRFKMADVIKVIFAINYKLETRGQYTMENEPFISLIEW
mgnify:CR=1 FL=1